MARAEKGLTLREAAARTGVAKETLSELERGKRHPHPGTLFKVAQGYGISVRDLMEEPVSFDEAPRETGPPDKEESVLDIVYQGVRRQYERDKQAARRALASEGIQQPASFQHEENALIPRLLKRPPDEIADALVDAVRVVVETKEENAELARGNARLKEENARLRAEAGQDRVFW